MADYDVSRLKNNIKLILDEKEITQVALSENTGIPQARISKVLSDRTSDSFTISQLVAISDYLGVSTDLLLLGPQKIIEEQNKEHLSAADICAMLVQIDKSAPFCIDKKEFEEYETIIIEKSSPIELWEMDSIKHNVERPILHFAEYKTSGVDCASDITYEPACRRINRFLEKYVEVRRLRDQRIIDSETFENIIASHLFKIGLFEENETLDP